MAEEAAPWAQAMGDEVCRQRPASMFRWSLAGCPPNETSFIIAPGGGAASTKKAGRNATAVVILTGTITPCQAAGQAPALDVV